jgi:hypothetical protein
MVVQISIEGRLRATVPVSRSGGATAATTAPQALTA